MTHQSEQLLAVDARDPRVCVCMITYNHEEYLSDAISSVLRQTGSFSLRLIIGEDCSTDASRQVCERFAREYPDRIVLLPSTVNLGIQKNFFRTLEACLDSDFVAFCEGDDMWSDCTKLEKQIGWLKHHPNSIAHAHNVYILDENLSTQELFGSRTDEVCAMEELLNDWPFHLVSLVARSEYLAKIPIPSLPYFISCDRFINMWLGCHGAIFYFGSRAMAVYRRHQRGASHNADWSKISVQELCVLDFLRPFIGDRRAYNLAKAHGIERAAFHAANQQAPLTKRTRFKLALEYASITGVANRSNLYHFLLILFGRRFWRAHQLIKQSMRRADT